MGAKRLFSTDYEFHASAKMLYPYLQTASGLAEWFCDDVKINNESKTLTFLWDNEEHKAIQVAHRANHSVKFQFLPEGEEDENDPAYLEFKVETNDLTQTVYLHISDYSDFEDQKELHDLWDDLVGDLKKIVGG
ncbi:MAG: ATPase [Cytophagia bacterium]|nr:ATPase [Cytophagia bacterium]NBW36030.1 ATPase [Cytophagia bacterium]